MKARGSGRAVSSQQVAFELKQKVVHSLNKLSDRDTCHLGVEELEKMVCGLGAEGITPFLSGIIETDSEQKSAVRKECVRIMGVLARFHGGLLAPHLGKMVASVIKRLKDTDSVVRDACVETVGMFALNVVRCHGGLDNGDGGDFLLLVKPLFEAMGEQNRYVQTGAALCLARVVDDTTKPPIQILHPMLNRVIKLLKNHHSMAKPALIELVRSIIQAGGVTTENVFSAAMTSILDALKSTDWTTRKAASVALAAIAANGVSYLNSFKSKCIHSLDGCRFDKVKPVRDVVLHALRCWKRLPGSDSPDISETGSSTKENFSRCYFPDASSVSDCGWADTVSRKAGSVSALSINSGSSRNKTAPLNVRKTHSNHVQLHETPKSNDWNIEISVPNTHAIASDSPHLAESEGSCITRTFETISPVIRREDTSYENDDDKVPVCSSIPDVICGSFETKHVTVTNDSRSKYDSTNCVSMNSRSVNGDGDTEALIYASKVDRKNLNSTNTDISPHGLNDCCKHISSEFVHIKKQLLEIESRQTSLFDLLQVFMGNSVDSLSMLQSKVQSLESAVDQIVQNLFHPVNHPAISNTRRLQNKAHSLSSSPRLSNCTPRPSVDTNGRQSSRLSVQSNELWEDITTLKSRSSCSVKEAAGIWRDLKISMSKDSSSKTSTQKNHGHGFKNSKINHAVNAQESNAAFLNSTVRPEISESKNGFWKQVKGFVCARDIEAAYMEVLQTDDDLVLIELMDRTGPVLEKLSVKTANEILCTLATHILDHRFVSSIVPWLQQVVDLSSVSASNHQILSTKVKRELLLSVQEAVSMEFFNPRESESLAQLAVQLRRIWCEETPRSICNPRKHALLQSRRVPACN